MLDVAGIYDRRVIPAGKIFIRQGEEGYDAFIIQSGKVRVFKKSGDREIDLAELGEDDLIGEMALIMDAPRTASAEALEETTVIVITRENFKRTLAKTDGSVQLILEMLTDRMNTHNETRITQAREEANYDPDAVAITRSFASKMKETRKELFVDSITPHMSNLIKALKAFNAKK